MKELTKKQILMLRNMALARNAIRPRGCDNFIAFSLEKRKYALIDDYNNCKITSEGYEAIKPYLTENEISETATRTYKSFFE